MSEQPAELKLTVGCISDRGLSKKRPLNEDSFLADPDRRIFAVADGVGGAESGEVASQTAVEVLDDAFQHHNSGDDAEDLMEIAIQRANQSIHQMAREHSKLSMMATTLVALYIDQTRATIGHVGDSRLYRLTPDGRLHRETADHSVVEEEVRAGRMTPEQAAHHPSRNVISRALGAEASVEADMKMIEIAPGTTFLLCSDGITRHIPDKEIETLLDGAGDLDQLCEEMKRICYERGAEDNLTAVIVRVGDSDLHRTVPANIQDELDERTILTASARSRLAETAPLAATAPLDETIAAGLTTKSAPRTEPLTPTGDEDATDEFPVAEPSRSQIAPASPPALAASETAIPKRSRRRIFGAAAALIIVPLMVLAASALAFYGGMFWERRGTTANTNGAIATTNNPVNAPVTSSARENSQADFDRRRREIDEKPSEWAQRIRDQQNSFPLTSEDPEFLYLYGRASLLSDNRREAMAAFERALSMMDARGYTSRNPLRIETLVTMTAAAASGNEAERQAAAQRLNAAIERRTGGNGATASPSAPNNSSPTPQVFPNQ